MSAKLNKNEMIKLALQDVPYAQICKMAFPDKEYKNPSSTIQKIIGAKRDLLAGEGPLLRPRVQVERDDDQGQENALEDSENALEGEKREYTRHNWAEHYEIIGPMLSKGASYKAIHEKITGSESTSASAGASVNQHINKKFGDKDRFLIWWGGIQEKEDAKNKSSIEAEMKEKFALQLAEDTKKQSFKIENLQKDNLNLKVVIELCKQKMTRKKVEELEKIASLFVNNFKRHDGDSLNSITSIVNALESYITAPIATNIEP